MVCIIKSKEFHKQLSHFPWNFSTKSFSSSFLNGRIIIWTAIDLFMNITCCSIEQMICVTSSNQSHHWLKSDIYNLHIGERERERNHYVCWVQVVVLFFFSCAIIIVVIVDVVFCCCCCCCVCGREFLRATHICMVVDVFIWLRRMIQTKKKFCAQNGVNVRKQMIIIKVVVVE